MNNRNSAHIFRSHAKQILTSRHKHRDITG